jgi:hypothetical protein
MTTDLEMLGLRRYGIEGQPRMSEEGVGQVRPVLDTFEPVLNDRGQVINAVAR